jgi:threonine synthase
LQVAIGEGAVPFTCQGPDNGLTVEGAMTLGYEMADGARSAGVAFDRLFVQVGGGALASAVVQGLREAASLGAMEELPRLHAVQTRGGYPLARAYDRVAARILERLGEPASLAGSAEGADRIREKAGSPEVEEELFSAARDRSSYMWPWETEPTSLATGILDDETYDWLAVVRGMVETGGFPVLVSEATLEAGNVLAREATGIDVDHTGSAGLAGLLEMKGAGEVDTEERTAVLLTGIRR